MIVSKIITLKTFGNRKLDYFFNLGYDVSGDTFSVKVEDLNSGSRQIIEVECDFCKRIVNVSYKEYLRNISGDINKYACSKLCGSKKAEEKNLKIHGISHPMKLKKVQDKLKRTNLERYGVEYLMQSSEIKNKSKETLIKRWGTSHISKTEHFKNKFKETCLQNNGVEYPMMSEDIREKSKSTLVDNYGVDNPSKSKEIKDVKKSNNIEKYGVEHTSMLDSVKNLIKNTKKERYGDENYNNSCKLKETFSNFTEHKWNTIKNKIKLTKLERYSNENYNNIEKIKETISNFTQQDWKLINNKRKNTNIERWGVENIVLNNEFRSRFNICKDVNYITYNGDGVSLFKCDLTENHNFSIHSDNFFHRKNLNLPLCTICHPIGDSHSIGEKDMLKFIKSFYRGEVINSYRDGLEIDIYLPEIKLGFEFNGLYWHSDKYKEKNYHIKKTDYFKVRGIRIVHIWEDDWANRKDIIKSQIINLINLTPVRIFARKCKVVELKSVGEFLNNNHIQGADRSNIKLGLVFNSELVSVMTFNMSGIYLDSAIN